MCSMGRRCDIAARSTVRICNPSTWHLLLGVVHVCGRRNTFRQAISRPGGQKASWIGCNGFIYHSSYSRILSGMAIHRCIPQSGKRCIEFWFEPLSYSWRRGGSRSDDTRSRLDGPNEAERVYTISTELRCRFSASLGGWNHRLLSNISRSLWISEVRPKEIRYCNSQLPRPLVHSFTVQGQTSEDTHRQADTNAATEGQGGEARPKAGR
mmetsp:Transcript_18616/g.30893  ORF Transcript_18616/g.30893 Transcript_18616/m.30893 type:complete len:210 (+) Transcript_18616:506-1135(+)